MSIMSDAFKSAGLDTSEYQSKRQPHNNRNKSIQREKIMDKNNIVTAETLPDNYIDEAERIMGTEDLNVTTSKIRNILAMVSEIYNVENIRQEKELLSQSIGRLNQLRVRLAYECGREPSVKKFVNKTKLMNYLKDIGNDRKKFIDYARYVEALVAYHRYFGGKEN